MTNSPKPQVHEDPLNVAIQSLDDTIVYWSRLYEDASDCMKIEHLQIRLHCAERITSLRQARAKLTHPLPPIVIPKEVSSGFESAFGANAESAARNIKQGERLNSPSHGLLNPVGSCKSEVQLPNGDTVHCQRPPCFHTQYHQGRDSRGLLHSWLDNPQVVTIGSAASGVPEAFVDLKTGKVLPVEALTNGVRTNSEYVAGLQPTPLPSASDVLRDAIRSELAPAIPGAVEATFPKELRDPIPGRWDHPGLSDYLPCRKELILPDGRLIHCQQDKEKHGPLHIYRDARQVLYRWTDNPTEVVVGDPGDDAVEKTFQPPRVTENPNVHP